MRIALLFIVFSAFSQATILRYPYNFSNYLDGNTWKGDWQRVLGEPVVPTLNVSIVIPEGEEVKSIQFYPYQEWQEKIPNLMFQEAPEPLCHVFMAPVKLKVFQTNESYPNQYVGNAIMEKRLGISVLHVSLYPTKVFPQSLERKVINGGELVVETKSFLSEQNPWKPVRTIYEHEYTDLLKGVDKFDALGTYRLSRARAKTDYLIVAPEMFLKDIHPQGLHRLIFQKKENGLRVKTLTTEKIKAEYAGSDIQEKIRTAIQQVYQNEGIGYVLLVGNGYSSTPTKILKVNLDEGNIPSDFYYACLSGDFKTKPHPLSCEVAVGRAPVTTLDDMHAFVEKTTQLYYLNEKDSSTKNVLNFGEVLDPSTLGSKIIDQLLNGGKAGNITTTGYGSSFNVTKLYETHGSTYKESDVISKFNNNEFYMVNHLGHASEGYCMRTNINSISKINTKQPFFAITQGCHPGNITKRNWATEMVLNPKGGAGAIIANSNYGYYNGKGSTDGPSNRFHLVFYDTIFRENIKNLGKIHFRAKQRLIPQINSDEFMRWVVYETNLLGDPELPLRF